MKKRRHLIQLQILVLVIFVVVVVTAVSTLISLNIERKAIQRDLSNTATLVNSTIYRSLEVAMIDQQKIFVERMVKNLSFSENIQHIRIFDLAGKVWSGSKMVEKEDITAQKIDEALQTGKPVSLYREEEGKKILETFTPIRSSSPCYTCHGSQKKFLGVIEVGINAESIDQRLNSYSFNQLTWTMVAIVMIIAVLFLALNYLVVSPIEKLIIMAERMTQGDLSKRVSLRTKNEIGELGDAFNQMAHSLAGSIEELKQTKLKMETAIRNIGEAMSSALDFESLFKVIIEQTISLAGFPACSLMLVNEMGQLIIRAADGFTSEEIEHYNKKPIKADENILFPVVRAKSIIAVESLESHPKLKKLAVKRKAKTLYAFPLFAELKFLGLITLVSSVPRKLTSDEIELLYTFSSEASIAISHARLHEKVKILAATDDLTGLPNVRTFHERVHAEIERARRFKHHLSLMMLDIDDFKFYNDQHGHLAGDELLWELSRVLESQVRSIDLLARYGGEEFVILLVETPLDEARLLAERVRKQVEKHVFSRQSLQPGGNLTISIGVASFPVHATSARELIDQADKALYKAKQMGKNQVVTAKRPKSP